MANYVYKARDVTGKQVRGTLEAVNKTELIDKLHKMGYMTTQVSEVISGREISSLFEKLKRINSNDMLLFYIQFANMLNAGLTLLSILNILAKQIENKTLRETVGDISRRIEAGEGLSQALSAHPRIFSRLFVNMVEAGEASGKLDTVLLRYAEFFEHQENLRQQVKGALFYPVILLCAGIMVMLFIVTFIIPQFVKIYLEAQIKLPLPTLLVYKTGMVIKHQGFLLMGLVILLGLSIKYYLKTEKGTFIFDKIKLKMPILGLLYRKVIVSRFSRTLGTLFASGVPILESLDITKEVMGNVVLERVIAEVRSSVERGEKISEPLKISAEFPPDVVQMIATGEETGNLDTMLYKIADFYDMIIGYAVKKLTTIIEPLFLVIMGGMVGLIMASMLLPIFDLVKILRR